MGECRCLRAHSHTHTRPLPHCAPVTCARDSSLRCSLRRRGSSTMPCHSLSSTRPLSMLPSSIPHMRLRHTRARTRARPFLCSSLGFRCVRFLPPAATARSTSLRRLCPSLSAYPCMVLTVYDERQSECAARYAFTGVSVSLQPYVRQPLASSLSHHIT